MQHCLCPSRLQSVSFPQVVQFIFIFYWENYFPHVSGYLLLLITVVCFHPLPALFKCFYCVLFKFAKRPEHVGDKKLIFSQKKKKDTNQLLHCWLAPLMKWWNLNLVSGKYLISGTCLWEYEPYIIHIILPDGQAWLVTPENASPLL